VPSGSIEDQNSMRAGPDLGGDLAGSTRAAGG
jgi:hypothetical protein